jgi:hypothetical protein
MSCDVTKYDDTDSLNNYPTLVPGRWHLRLSLIIPDMLPVLRAIVGAESKMLLSSAS